MLRYIAVRALLIPIAVVLVFAMSTNMAGGSSAFEAFGHVFVWVLLLSGFMVYLLCGPYEKR